MEFYITFVNAAPFDIQVTIFSNHEPKQYAINSGGQVMHAVKANEDGLCFFKTKAQQLHGTISSREVENNATGDMTLQVVLDDNGRHLSFGVQKEIRDHTQGN